ncbi:MAG: helix-turn-helix transcriptional regulator [Oscillospiraceae bacterium]|nr:helix-turn-helix transcriptional regulator [Oscillospiraceae bacterium]
MNEDFSRTLALLRQEKGIAQRQAAKDLGISQALLSHYENGVREPGLAFVRKACDYYRVSADYLLGRTLDRDGAVIDAQELYDASSEKGSLKGSIAATLQKKLLVNTTSLLFELLGGTGSREAVNAAAGYLGGALYQLYRMLHRAAGGKDKFFALGGTAFSMDAVDAEMRLARVSFAQALDALESEDAILPAMDSAALSQGYPGLTQSLTQVLHATEEETNKLLGR